MGAQVLRLWTEGIDLYSARAEVEDPWAREPLQRAQGRQYPGRAVVQAGPDDLGGKDPAHDAPRWSMKKKISSVAAACRDEATAALEQAKASKKRAHTLRIVAAARRAAALHDEERASGLRREAVLSEREAVNHEDMARVFEAEAHRAE